MTKEFYKKIADRLMPNPTRDIDMYNFLLEVKEKFFGTSTEEEVKKEWEELGYKWIKFRNGDILVINDFTDITFKQCAKEVLMGNIYDDFQILTMKEITLIDKTRKMLGWNNE